MKNTIAALPILGLVLGFAGPAGATSMKSLILQSGGATSIVQQQETCKEGEIWDETEQKCKKKEM